MDTASGTKLVVIGDGAVGKTCLLIVYAKGTFPPEYVPTVFDNYTAKVKLNDTVINVQIWDTAGQEELENIRTLSYANTSVFLLCYSVVDKGSFENIEQVWLPELAQFVHNPTILLVGTKTDLRDNPESLKRGPPLTYEQGVEKAKKIGAIGYVECSAIKNDGVKDVFDTAIQYATSTVEGGCTCLLV